VFSPAELQHQHENWRRSCWCYGHWQSRLLLPLLLPLLPLLLVADDVVP
jgi:hypothetical protein